MQRQTVQNDPGSVLKEDPVWVSNDIAEEKQPCAAETLIRSPALSAIKLQTFPEPQSDLVKGGRLMGRYVLLCRPTVRTKAG